MRCREGKRRWRSAFLAAGVRDENDITNLIFWARHPTRWGRKLRREDPDFGRPSREWLEIRSQTRLALRALRWHQVLTGGTDGNEVQYLIRGPVTFRSMVEAIRTAKNKNHYIYLLAWWLSDDFPLIPGDWLSDIRSLFKIASSRGVQIRAMLWRQPDGKNRAEARRISALSTGGAILDGLTMPAFGEPWPPPLKLPYRLGSHHQKVLIVSGEQGLIVFCGGIDINPDRIRPVPSKKHPGCPAIDPNGTPHHDVHCRIRGPAAHDLLKVFIRRWHAHPESRKIDSAKGSLLGRCEPIPSPVGRSYVKIAATFNLVNSHACAQDRSVQSTMIPVIRAARRSIYIEDQYLVLMRAAQELRTALAHIDSLRIVIPHPSISDLPHVWAPRKAFVDYLLSSPYRKKVKVCYLRSPNGEFGAYTYVHSKTWTIDGEVTIIGSANCNRRGWSYDSEAIAAIYDPGFARSLQTDLLRLHSPMMRPYDPNEAKDSPRCSRNRLDWDKHVDPCEAETIPACPASPLPGCPPAFAIAVPPTIPPLVRPRLP